MFRKWRPESGTYMEIDLEQNKLWRRFRVVNVKYIIIQYSFEKKNWIVGMVEKVVGHIRLIYKNISFNVNLKLLSAYTCVLVASTRMKLIIIRYNLRYFIHFFPLESIFLIIIRLQYRYIVLLLLCLTHLSIG